jgi:hypothetical protein
MQDLLLDIKYWLDDPNDVYSRVLQMIARYVSDDLDRSKKKNTGAKLGYSIGSHRESIAALSTGWQFIGRPSEP